MTLEQLMAFTVSGDHERQEQVWERLQSSYTREPYVIRRLLTEGAVRASDKRARFIGIEAYEAAGGAVLRDLFQGDDGGWLQDVALVDRLVAERLAREAEAVRAEGWRWIEVAPGLPLRPHLRPAPAARRGGAADRGAGGRTGGAAGRVRPARGSARRPRRSARGGRSAAGRDRGGAGRLRRCGP